MNRIIKRVVLPLGAAAVVGSAGFAYMATNTVDPSNAGQGTGTVSGYHVYDVHYPAAGLVALGTSQPGDSQNGVTQVAFKVDPDNAGFTAVDLYDNAGTLLGGGGATNCSRAGSGVWTCTVGTLSGNGPIPVTDIKYVDVEAVQTN